MVIAILTSCSQELAVQVCTQGRVDAVPLNKKLTSSDASQAKWNRQGGIFDPEFAQLQNEPARERWVIPGHYWSTVRNAPRVIPLKVHGKHCSGMSMSSNRAKWKQPAILMERSKSMLSVSQSSLFKCRQRMCWHQEHRLFGCVGQQSWNSANDPWLLSHIVSSLSSMVSWSFTL